MQNHVSPKQTTFFKPSSAQQDQAYRQDKNKILPMPIIRTHLPNSPTLRRRLQINRYKNFSKISAAGPHTLQILQSLKRSSCTLKTPKFEFDPYLCDSSCLTELGVVLRKLKSIKQLCLIIRRFDGQDELSKLGPSIYKMTGLQKIKYEFPSTPNIKEEHLMEMHHILTKCYSLKSFEWTATEGPVTSARYFESSVRLMKRLVKLENYKESFANKKRSTASGLDESRSFQNPPKFPNIKTLSLAYASTQEWSGMSENGDTNTELAAHYVSRYVGLEGFKVKLRKRYFSSQEILVWMKIFTSMLSLKYLGAEFLTGEFGELELLTVAYGLSLITQINSVSLKFIQKAPIPVDYIIQFISKVITISNLEKIDIYFRIQTFRSSEINQLKDVFSRFPDINYSFGKQTLHIYKSQ